MNRRLGWSAPAALWLLGACATPTADVRDFAGQPPLDCAVLVVGGAFVSGGAEPGGTFVAAAGTDAAPRGAAEQGAVARDEAPPADAPAALPIEDIVGALAKGSVFQRVVLEPDAARRADVRRRNRTRKNRPVAIIQGRYPAHTPAAPQPRRKVSHHTVGRLNSQ